MLLGKNILKLCKEKGITLSYLAKSSGVPVQTLHGWTTGRRAVQLDQLRRVALVLQISVHELAYGEHDPNAVIGQEVLKELFRGDVRITVHQILKTK